LAAHEVHTIELDELHEPPLASPSALAEACFCAACRAAGERAGLDVDAAARSVRVHFDRITARPLDPARLQALAQDELVAAYMQARLRDTDAWLERHNAQLASPRLRLLLPPGDAALAARASWAVVDLTQLAEAALVERLGGFGQAPPYGVRLSGWGECVPDAGALVRTVAAARDAGIRLIQIAGLALAPDEAQLWLRQAARWARRG
jgi:hypothetical protein